MNNSPTSSSVTDNVLVKPNTTHPAGNFLRGVIMGCADLVPGVSGGTMALITGIYERLVASVRGLTSLPISVLKGDFKAFRRDVEWLLLLPVLLGMGSAIVLGAKVIEGLLEQYPAQMLALFLGLIVASLPIPWRMIETHTTRTWLLAALGAVLAFVLTAIPPASITDPSHLVVFTAAAVAICAMVLPGVSGSYLLLVLGMYEVTLSRLNDRDFQYIFIFAAGALVGLGLFTRLLEWLLKNHHAATMAVLVGMMVGSTRALWPWQGVDDRSLLAPSGTALQIAAVFAFFVVGLVVVTVIDRVASRRAT